jgi:hypothetical protein
MAIGDARLLADGKEIYEANRPARGPVPAATPKGRRQSDEQATGRHHGRGHRLVPSATTWPRWTRRCAKAAPASAFGARVRELGLRSQVGGKPEIDLEARIDRKLLRFMGDAAAYAYPVDEAGDRHAGLAPNRSVHPRTGLVAGSGGGPANQV